MLYITLTVLMLFSVFGLFIDILTIMFGVHGLTYEPRPWNHPGEPALFDMLLSFGGFAFILTVPLWLYVRRHQTQLVSKFWIWYARGVVVMNLTLVGIGMLGILERHSGRWSAVRNGMHDYIDSVARVTGLDEGGITAEERATIRRLYVPDRVPVDLPGHGTVWLMNWGKDDVIYVNIGGDMAHFEPCTMYCIDSD